MSRKPKDIVCIEESSNDNGFLTNSFKVFRRELRVRTVSDMIDQIIHRLRGRLLGKLYIIGHGKPGYQSVGNGQNVLTTNGRSLALRTDRFLLEEDAETQLGRLRGKFATNGKIILGGCRVADEDIGKGLLMRISTVLDNIIVEGSKDKQYPPLGMEGIVIRCIGKSTCTVNVKAVCSDGDDD